MRRLHQLSIVFLVGCGGVVPESEAPSNEEEKGDGIAETAAGLQAVADAAGGDAATVVIDGHDGKLSLTYRREDAIGDLGISSLEEYEVDFDGFSLDGLTFVDGTLHYLRSSQVGSEGIFEQEDLEGSLAITGEEKASLVADLRRIDGVGSSGVAGKDGKLEIEGQPFEVLTALLDAVRDTVDDASASR
jgi:hypothetical protein